MILVSHKNPYIPRHPVIPPEVNGVLGISMVVEMVPLKGGIGCNFHPPGSARTISGI